MTCACQTHPCVACNTTPVVSPAVVCGGCLATEALAALLAALPTEGESQ